MDTQLTPFVGTVDINVKVLEKITQICDDHIYGSSSKLERQCGCPKQTWMIILGGDCSAVLVSLLLCGCIVRFLDAVYST